ncbi:MAG: sigma 54-interacting transcriptional regulator [Bacteroidetes bacterium]|nr:sigma 54-interacting transcriptional regulator [Bacteroidota bacterium]
MKEAELNTVLRNELDIYRRLLDHIPAELGIFDLQGKFIYNTPSGIKDPEVRKWVVGKTHHDYCKKRNYPIIIADKRQKVMEQVVKENKIVPLEELWIDKQGKERYYIRLFSPVTDAHNKVTHVIGYGQEITDLKKSQNALREALREVKHLKDRLQAENAYLQQEIKLTHNFEEIVTRNKKYKEVLASIEQVAATSATVLILGESGTGKELLARAVHNISKRSDRPIVKVNCATLPANLIESELFGHEKGAFTGALTQKIGRFELADDGTIFLDEIGELPLELQSKLLRVLQEGEFERLGNPKTIKVDVRVMAATNKDLETAMTKKEFREDLFYRLNVFPITSIPLRDRKDDIPLLVDHFYHKYAARFSKKIGAIPKRVIDSLMDYHWPGNIRELENIIERAVIISKGKKLKLGDFSPQRMGIPQKDEITSLQENQKSHILRALESTNWRISGDRGAAKLLGIKRTTLNARMKKLKIQRS